MKKTQLTEEQERALKSGDAVLVDGRVITNPKKSNKFRSVEKDIHVDDLGVLRI